MITEGDSYYYHICPSIIDYEHFELGHINLDEMYKHRNDGKDGRWGFCNGDGHNVDYAKYCHECGTNLFDELKAYLEQNPHRKDCLARKLIIEKPTGFFIAKFGQIYFCPICGVEL